MPTRVSILDQSPIRADTTAAIALAESVQLAQRADELGFHRYWLAEHHGSQAFAGSSPEILISRIASVTKRIRVGSGGVMLMHYSPYKVAENFKVLESLFPGRIDVGIGRAPGSDGITAAALAYGSNVGPDYFPAKLADLKAFISDGVPLTEGLRSVRATPATPNVPELWVLGSSDQSGMLAAHFGVPFSFAHFINAPECAAAIETYRARYRPSPQFPQPRVNIGVFALCAETPEAAQQMGACRDLWRLRFEKGEFGPYPSADEAINYPYSAAELLKIEERRSKQILGDPASVHARLQALADEFSVEELMVLSITPTFEQRVRNYELIAAAFGLQSPGE